MNAFSYDKNAQTFKASISMLVALENYPDVPAFDSEDSLLANEKISMSDMAVIHNKLTETDSHVNKFKDRAIAARRTWAATVAALAAKSGEPTADAPAINASDTALVDAGGGGGGGDGTAPEGGAPEGDGTAPAPAPAPAPTTEAVRKRGRQPGSGEFAGRKLFPLVKDNPRRAGTAGWQSFEILRATPGLEYNAYLEAGGRPQDLRWDIGHAYSEVK